MNYEEKCKEALKIMESLHSVVKYQSSSDALLASQTIEKAFPELRESEDEKIRKEIIQSIKDNMCVIHKEKCLDWLEKQGEQHSWSEEDEKMVEDIIEAIDTQYAVSDYNEMVSWLKLLKPQNRWKPTEEQLGALKYFISFHEDHARSLTTKWEEFKNLESLYNDLKSL